MSALRPRSVRQAGATLVEMVLVVAVIGIAVLVTLPRTDPVASFAADAMAGEVASALRFGQQEAIRSGRYHVVQMDPANQMLSVYRLSNSGLVGRDTSVKVLHPLERSEYLLSFMNNSLPSARIVASAFTYGGIPTNYASFGPDGLPVSISGYWNNGTPVVREPLQGDGVVTLRHGQAERQVRLNPVTGRVTY